MERCPKEGSNTELNGTAEIVHKERLPTLNWDNGNGFLKTRQQTDGLQSSERKSSGESSAS